VRLRRNGDGANHTAGGTFRKIGFGPATMSAGAALAGLAAGP
jgi:hypothetical protein